MNKCIIIFCISLSSCLANAQNSVIDSLKQVLLTAKEDTTKLITMDNLGGQYIMISDFNMVIKTAEDNLNLAEKIIRNEEKGSAVWKVAKMSQIRSYTQMGIVHRQQGNFPESLKNHAASMAISDEIGDKKTKGGSYINVGAIYWEQNNYPEALKNYFAGLKLLEEIDYKPWIANAYANIGVIYSEQHNYSEALKYLESGLKIKEEIGDRRGVANSYLNIGSTYEAQGNKSEALKMFKAAQDIYSEIGDRKNISNAKMNIGSLYTDLGNYSEALTYLAESLEMKKEIGDKEGIASASNALGTVYLKQRKYELAQKYFIDALTISTEIEIMDGKVDAYSGLAAVDSATGNWKAAFEHYKLEMAYRDSILNEENTRKTVRLQMQYDFDKKEAQAKAEQDKKDAVALKELQKQKLVRNGFIGGFAVVLIFAGVFFTQRNKIKLGKKRSDELLLNILPAEVAEELKAKGTTTAKDYSDVTVLFTDFKNFTELSEKLNAQELVNEINYCYSAFDSIITKYGIEKIKTIGDSYMCAGGLPVANKTNAIDTVAAAIEIRNFIETEKQKRISAGLPYFEIRIGCNTGSVVAGIVGIKKFAYDIWGDTVNIASRMESSGEIGKVNISGSTYELVKSKYKCEYRGKMEAKYKGEIDMYFVESVL